MKNSKNTESLSSHTNYLYKRLVLLNFDMFTVIIITFFCKFPVYVASPEKRSILFDGMIFLNCSYMEVGVAMPGLAGDGKSMLARFHVNRKFLANEIYHFVRLSH